jgi:hypothetical protein
VRVAVTILIIGAIAALAGCIAESSCAYGIVGWNKEFSIGSFAPDISLTLANGEQTTLHEVRQPVTILAFISPYTETCQIFRPDLVSIRKQLHVLPVTVVQVLLPVGECPRRWGHTDVGRLNKYEYDIIALCDPGRTAWRAYGQPEPDTLVLVDQKSKIVDIQNSANSKKLLETAYWMARNMADRHSCCADD